MMKQGVMVERPTWQRPEGNLWLTASGKLRQTLSPVALKEPNHVDNCCVSLEPDPACSEP